MALLAMPLRTMWSEVQEVRERVETLLADLPTEVRAATVMTASELVENAIKYGESVPAAPHASVALDYDGQRVEVIVKNGVASPESVEALRAHVARLAAATDRTALYIQRLQELMMSGGGSTQLGIYRIGCEGNFDVECEYANQVVTVRATRQVPREG
jgi:hypothetical protein